jgi:hypothetical protein
MSYEKTGGPAFPHPAGWRRDPEVSDGMTLRDYFAAKAMQSFITQGPVQNDFRFAAYAENVATVAYFMADAMLTARGQE